MVPCDTEVTARPGAECFDRPLRLRDGHFFFASFPALRTGLLSLSPSLLRPAAASPWRGLRVAGAPQLEERRRPPGYGGQAGTSLQRILLSPYVDAHVAAAGRRSILQEVS
jgi:hypothetical protein